MFHSSTNAEFFLSLLFPLSQNVRVSVLGHSNCPRDLSAPGYTFKNFVKSGARLSDIHREPLNDIFFHPADKVIIFLIDNEFRTDMPKYIISKLKSLYYLIKNRVCNDVTIVDILPRHSNPPSRVTTNEISRSKNLKNSLRNFVRHRSIPFISLNHARYLECLKPDGVHLNAEGRRRLKEDILKGI